MRQVFITAFLCASLIFGVRTYGARPDMHDVHILSTSQRSVVLAFSPHRLRVDSLILDGKLYQKIDFKLASMEGEPEHPMIPCRVLVVGVPPDGDVQVSMTASESDQIEGIRLLPVPHLQRENDLPQETYVEGAIYGQPGTVPGRPFDVEQPTFWGDQRIIRIRVYPVQFDALNRRVILHTKMVFRVEFGSPPRESFTPRRRPNETVYRNALVNYSQARTWRFPLGRSMKKVRSRFRTGLIYKLPVNQEGVYSISGSFLTGQGIDIGSIQPSTMKMYNNGGRELPRDMAMPRPDSLVEVPILLTGMEDGRFDANDAILFYGRDVTGWEYDRVTRQYNHYIHHYTNTNIYWLVFNDGIPGRRVEPVPSPSLPVDRTITDFRDRFFVEEDIFNHLNAGIHWGWQLFVAPSSNRSLDLVFNDPVPNDTLVFRFQFMGAASGLNQFQIRFNEQAIRTVQFSGPSQGSGPRINFYTQTVEVPAPSIPEISTLSFSYQSTNQGGTAYLDWYEAEYARYLRAHEGRLRFDSPQSEGNYAYRLSGFDTEPLVWDVTNSDEIRQMTLRSVSGAWEFTDSAEENNPKHYMAVQPSAYLAPGGMSQVTASDLRNPGLGADLVIITHEDFYDQALRLASLREEQDSLSVFVADIQDVFDAFAWGLPDPVAIRDFMMVAFQTWSVRPSYLLLFGDGDYDYKNRISDGDANWIPPFEYDALTESQSRATDDWFTYVNGQDTKMDLAVGRIPVQSSEEARTVVDKIIQYETDPNLGDWRSLITMVGDDEKAGTGDENEITHTRATEDIAENVIPPLFNFKKIYLTEYPEEITVGGRRQPAAQDDLVDQINRGTLLVNFIGHGNESLWAHERVFEMQTDLIRLQNQDRLPFFYAATCAFGLYDDPEQQSFGEELINRSGKGAIGVVAASRFCSAASNEALNKAFIDYLFDDYGPTLRLGDAMRLAKLTVASTANNEMYHIFGDPTMRLGMPRYQAIVTSVEPDTLRALSLIRVEGQIKRDDVDWVDFGGRVSVEAFDSKKNVVYTTQYGTTLPYLLPGNAVYRGQARAEGGHFQVSFIMPKDIFYGGHTGRITCYFWDDEIDGAGYRDDIEVGGSSELVDNQGPEIALLFDGLDNFITGGMVPEEPILVAEVQDDKSGINITGEIGHKIILTIDGDRKEDATDYFQYDEGSYLGGKVQYPLTGVGIGDHDLSMKVWDNANNSSIQSIAFRVIPEGDIRIEEVLNYPNPFAGPTTFTFKLNRDADVAIKVFTVDGRLIRQIEGILGEPGFNMIPWDGRDDMGDELANGVYLYKVMARVYAGDKELKEEVIGRLMVMR